MDSIGSVSKQSSMKTLWAFSSLLFAVTLLNGCSGMRAVPKQQSSVSAATSPEATSSAATSTVEKIELASTSTDEIFPDNPVIGNEPCGYENYDDCSNLDPRVPPAKASPAMRPVRRGPIIHRPRFSPPPLSPERRQQICDTCNQRVYPYPHRRVRRVPIQTRVRTRYYGFEGDIGGYGSITTTTRIVDGQEFMTYTYQFFEQRPDRLLQTPIPPPQTHMNLCWLLANHGYNFYTAHERRAEAFYAESCDTLYGYEFRPWWEEE